ncbi:MAG: ATP-dependent Clp protease proteolytic subunit [Elusimicrobia bacterium]|nr:ATP-dependent Clp protease proteolytic subunit [Elusimicrobiota bacterium]
MKNLSVLCACCLAASAALPLAAQPSEAKGAPAASAAPAVTPEQAELTKLTSENQLAEQKAKKKLQKLNDDREELRAQYELLLQKQKLAIAELEAEATRLGTQNRVASEQHRLQSDAVQTELDKLSTENRLAEEKRKAQAAALDAEFQRLSLQNRLSDERNKGELAKQDAELLKLGLANRLAAEKNKQTLDELSRQVDKLRLENDLRAEQQRQLLMADDREKRAIELSIKRLDLEERKLQVERVTMDGRMAKLKSDLELRDRVEDWKKEANKDPLYLDKPFLEGRLVISDRRISLNGPIFGGVADYVTERIHYYNNISSTQAIFIVIDRCPGGSVMEGYRIVKAMQASKAPVHVVVKSFAASMAAVITTMADKSYVYPNAILLHHQMSTMNWGNMTQLREQLELAKEWERRLHLPVAQKMGISLDEFRKKMYEKNSDGDWEEFGDKAVGYKWASSVVHEIAETGFTKNPEFLPKPPAKPLFGLDERSDEKGQRFVTLPRLDPFDFYFIYNPDRYYR